MSPPARAVAHSFCSTAVVLALHVSATEAAPSLNFLPWSNFLADKDWRGRGGALWPLLQMQQHPAPAVGATYVGTMSMPILGKQTFMIRVLTRSHAQITLVGALNLDEPAKYAMSSDGSGVLEIEFSPPTLALLWRYRTRIRSVKYSRSDDSCRLVIQPGWSWIPAFHVRLSREQVAK